MHFSTSVFGSRPAGLGACCVPCSNGKPCLAPVSGLGESTLPTYTIVRGDTLSKIEKKVGVPWRELAMHNAEILANAQAQHCSLALTPSPRCPPKEMWPIHAGNFNHDLILPGTKIQIPPRTDIAPGPGLDPVIPPVVVDQTLPTETEVVVVKKAGFNQPVVLAVAAAAVLGGLWLWSKSKKR